MTLGERLPRWPFVAAGLVTSLVWLARHWLRQQVAVEARVEGWAAAQVAELLAGQGEHGRAALCAALEGRPCDPRLTAWIDAQGLGVSLEYARTPRGAQESLRIETQAERRRVERDRAWDELPAPVRAAFLRGERQVVLPWRAPWREAEGAGS